MEPVVLKVSHFTLRCKMFRVHITEYDTIDSSNHKEVANNRVKTLLIRNDRKKIKMIIMITKTSV